MQASRLWKLVSRVFVENQPSRALLKSLGFREAGIYERHGRLDGEWRDVVIVERQARSIHEGRNSPPFGLRLRPDSRAFAQDSPGRRLERRAKRGVETGGSKNTNAAGALFKTRSAHE